MMTPPDFWGGGGLPYLGEHDVLAPPAQRDAQEVIDGRSIPQAHRPVLLLLRGPAQHHIPSSLQGHVVGKERGQKISGCLPPRPSDHRPYAANPGHDPRICQSLSPIPTKAPVTGRRPPPIAYVGVRKQFSGLLVFNVLVCKISNLRKSCKGDGTDHICFVSL